MRRPFCTASVLLANGVVGACETPHAGGDLASLERDAAPTDAAAASDASTAAVPLAPPSAYFDLSHWKLTLPVAADGGTTGLAATIATSELTNGYTSPYFFTRAGPEMVFFAPSDGATTTPGTGSDHARSELREVFPVDGGTEWTNRVGGTMTATCTVLQASTGSDEATIGQIHGLSSTFVILALYPARHAVRVKLTPQPNAATTYIDVADGIEVGDIITYTLKLDASELRATVNGHAMAPVAVDPAWDDMPLYFKAGAYSAASSSGNPLGAATEVSFRALTVAHP